MTFTFFLAMSNFPFWSCHKNEGKYETLVFVFEIFQEEKVFLKSQWNFAQSSVHKKLNLSKSPNNNGNENGFWF